MIDRWGSASPDCTSLALCTDDIMFSKKKKLPTNLQGSLERKQKYAGQRGFGPWSSKPLWESVRLALILLSLLIM